MKKFIFKATLFLCGGLILVQALAVAANRLAPDTNTLFFLNDKRHVEQLLARSAELEALAVGNSHTATISLETLGYNGYRYTRADSDFFETRQELESLLPYLPNVHTVFMPVSVFSFRWNTTAAEETKLRRLHMYATLPSWQFIEGDGINLLHGKSQSIFPLQSLLREDNWEAIFWALLGRARKQDLVEITEDDCRSLESEALVDHVQKRAARTTRLITEMTANRPGLENDTYQALVEITQYLQARRIRVVFFTPPYFKTYNEFYQARYPEMIALMQQMMAQLQQDYRVEYYDFSTDTEFTSANRLFADSDHLNGCGAQLFSAKFKQVLNKNQELTKRSVNSN